MIAGYLNYTITEQEISNNVENDLTTIVEIQKDRVNHIVEQNLERYQLISDRPQIKLSLENFQNGDLSEKMILENFLVDTTHSISDIDDIFIVNNDDIGIVSTNPDYVDRNFSNDSKFDSTFTESHMFIDEIDGIPKLFLCGPLILNDVKIGGMGIILDANTLLSVVLNYSQLGETGESHLAKLNSDGNVIFITPLRFAPDAAFNKVIPIERIDLPIVQAILKNEDFFSNTADYRGVDVLAITRYIDDTDWALVMKIDKDEAYESLSVILNTTIFSVVLVSASVTTTSVFLSSRLSSRLSKLSAMTKRISSGKFDRIEISGNDELDLLANDINHMSEKLNKLQHDVIAHERFATIGELSSRLAHDLRNPLSIVKGALRVLFDNRNDLTENDKRKITMINNAIDRMGHQINDVLVYVKTKSNILDNQDLLSIIKTSLLNFTIPDSVNITLPAKSITTNCDPTQIEAVFSNLIQNALDAINFNGEIKIRIKNEANTIIEFEDSGPVISDDILNNMFEPLFTTKQKGTGLGLSSCKRIIQNHGGTINVKNNPTIFTIELPKI